VSSPDVEGSIVFHHARKLGCERIASKRLGSQYRPGWSNDWIKVKNPGSTGGQSRGGRGLGHHGQTFAMTSRRFPLPWTVEDVGDDYRARPV
jgi:hypothetical protein